MTRWEYIIAIGITEANQFGRIGYEAYQVSNYMTDLVYHMKRKIKKEK